MAPIQNRLRPKKEAKLINPSTLGKNSNFDTCNWSLPQTENFLKEKKKEKIHCIYKPQNEYIQWDIYYMNKTLRGIYAKLLELDK